MSTIINSLKIVAFDSLLLHEGYESKRLRQVAKDIKDKDFLYNPPLATEIPGGKYLIIDGAHRVMSLKALKCKRIIVQVIEQKDFNVLSWDHLVPNDQWLSDLLKDNNFSIEKSQERRDLIAVITDYNKRKYFIYPKVESTKIEMIRCWNKLVDYYKNKYPVERINPDNQKNLLLHKSLLVSHVPWSFEEIIESVTNNNLLMPAGVTRFVIENRLLNLNIPLSLLMEKEFSNDLWQELINNWNKSIRHYTSSVYVCDI